MADRVRDISFLSDAKRTAPPGGVDTYKNEAIIVSFQMVQVEQTSSREKDLRCT